MRTNEMKTTDNRIQNLTGRPTVEIWSAGSILGSLSLPKGPSARRGTALVLVIVLLALLAILGTSFVLTTRVERVAAKNQLAAGGMDQAVNSVIEVIKSTLAEDLWGRPEDVTTAAAIADPGMMNNQRLLGLPTNNAGETQAAVNVNAGVNFTTWNGGTPTYYCLNEPWDAPVRFSGTADFRYFTGGAWPTIPLTLNVDGDPWLASSEIAGGVWPQGSDLFLVKFTNTVTQTDYWPTGVFNNIPISDFKLPTTHTNYPDPDEQERYADADGDGVLDSVWLYQKGFFPENPNTKTYTSLTYADVNDDGNYLGLVTDLPIKSSDPNLTYRMAIRIVDTSGMVNVNTAWQVPSDLPASSDSMNRLNQHMGNTLSGANLYGCYGNSSNNNYAYSDIFGYIGNATTPNPDRALPGKVQDPTLQDIIDFQTNYILQIERPNWTMLNTLFPNFYPLDLSDEMELRYRWINPGLGYASGSLQPGSRSVLENRFPELYGDANANGTIDDIDGDSKYDSVNDPATYANLQKRKFLTAYSFSRNVRTTPMNNTEAMADFDGRMKNLNYIIYTLVYRIKEGAFPGVKATEQADVQQFVQLIYQSFHDDHDQASYADYNNGVNFASAGDQATYHTWQYIANLVDYLDDDDDVTELDTNDAGLRADLGLGTVDTDISFNGNNHVYGLEKHAVISEVVVTCKDYTDAVYDDDGEGTITAIPAKAQYDVQVELYNPWNEPTTPACVKYFYMTDESGSNQIHDFQTRPLSNEISSDIYTSAITLVGTSIDLTSTPTGKTVEGEQTPTTQTSYNIKLIIVTYANSGATIPEDIFVIPLDSYKPTNPTVPITKNHYRSFERSCKTVWSLMANNPKGRRERDSDNKIDDPPVAVFDVDTLGEANDWGSDPTDDSTACGYATVTVDNSIYNEDDRDATAARRLTDVVCDPNIADLWHETPANGKFAKIRNWGDLLAVPYVGYCRDANREYKGIGDWLSETDNTLRFDLTEAADNQKGYLLREGLLNRYTILNREDDGVDQLGGGTADTKDEMRLPGLININTAPVAVRSALHPLIQAGAAIGGALPYKSINEFCTNGGNVLLNNANQDINILNLSTLPNEAQDVLQRQGLFTRIANLITTRSDTFVAYIYVQMLDAEGNVVTERREMALFDRSLCNEPPLRWNGTAWEPNPAYRPVKVVARQTIN